MNELEMALDHVHPENITWKEFQLWFQGEGEARDMVHDAQLHQIGMTRIEEEQTYDLSKKRVEPKIEMMIPITLSNAHLLFIVFENRLAKFFNLEDMKCVHKLHFEISYKLDVEEVNARAAAAKKLLSMGCKDLP